MKTALFCLLSLSFFLLACNQNNNENESGKTNSIQIRSGGDLIEVEISENVESYELENDTLIQGFVFAEGTPVGFFPSGMLRFGILGEDFISNGMFFPAGTFLELNEQGMVVSPK